MPGDVGVYATTLLQISQLKTVVKVVRFTEECKYLTNVQFQLKLGLTTLISPTDETVSNVFSKPILRIITFVSTKHTYLAATVG